MYSNEQSRINAIMVTFLFWACFYKEYCFGKAICQAHAKEASKIIGIMLVVYIFYFFIQKYINIDASTRNQCSNNRTCHYRMSESFLSCTLSLLCLFVKYSWRISVMSNETVFKYRSFMSISVPSEEEKSRILASMIPFLGIWITKKILVFYHDSWSSTRITFCLPLHYFTRLFQWSVTDSDGHPHSWDRTFCGRGHLPFSLQFFRLLEYYRQNPDL